MTQKLTRTTLIILLIACFAAAPFRQAKAQTYIKTNALYWAVLVPNVSVETKLWKHFTFNTDLVGSMWKSINGKPYLIGQLIPEFRYYPKEANRGFYVGFYTGGHVFKMSKWNYHSNRYQVGAGVASGFTLGYELPIAKRWLMDFYVGGGRQWSWYRGFRAPNDPLYEPGNTMYVDWNGSAEYVPYKIGVTFSYRVSKEKR